MEKKEVLFKYEVFTIESNSIRRCSDMDKLSIEEMAHILVQIEILKILIKSKMRKKFENENN